MSYCVNCGVELEASAEKCALCGTPVINPNVMKTEEEHVFPEKIVIPKDRLKRYRAAIATLIMLVPTIICIPVNRFITPESNWSVYVVSTSVLLWMFFVAPFFLKKTVPQSPYLALVLDGVITVIYIYVFYWMNSSGTWFYRIAVPLVAVFTLLGLLVICFLGKKKYSAVRKTAFVFAMIAVFAAAVEFVFLISMPNLIVDCVTIIVFFTMAAMAIFLRFASENRQFRAWISRKFFL